MDVKSVFSYFPAKLCDYLSLFPPEEIREIRLRCGAPPVILTDTLHLAELEAFTPADIRRCAERMCENSVYARQEEIRKGYLTLPGGHRAGLCGKTVTQGGAIRYLSEISSINLRIAHQILGAADAVMPSIVSGDDILSTLIISPPACGKTTLLRDIARQLGGGTYAFRVGIADERGEIAAMYGGMPQNDVGPLTDVCDGCPKAEGMRILLRGMSPRVIITDELGTREDEEAVSEMVRSGVRVICSLHGYDRADAAARQYIGPLLSAGIFRRIILLRGVGEIFSVL